METHFYENRSVGDRFTYGSHFSLGRIYSKLKILNNKMLSIDKISIIWQKMKQNILNVGCGTIFESKYSSIHRSHMNKFFLVPSNYKKRRQKLSTWLNLGLINLKNVDTIFKRLQWERRISASYSQYSWDEILLRCNLNENVHLFEQLIPISVICENFRKIPKLILDSL